MIEQRLQSFFERLDSEFYRIEKIIDDIFVYRASDVLVQNLFELPIIVSWPQSRVQFKFSTSPGDVFFSAVFLPALEEGQTSRDLKYEMIVNLGLVPSSSRDITGSFDLPSEGIVVFMFDNNFDWSATKKLSYIIEVEEVRVNISPQ